MAGPPNVGAVNGSEVASFFRCNRRSGLFNYLVVSVLGGLTIDWVISVFSQRWLAMANSE